MAPTVLLRQSSDVFTQKEILLQELAQESLVATVISFYLILLSFFRAGIKPEKQYRM
jgi:hypothetical protein